ncbi:MAG TPA: choice-of-anchor D domain-containing protein, partial [Thermoanaerobaculia bacterium]|nr:choice-of-anchor D domain-containing protein [Thermoanaerobaculia bacterium]
MTETTNHTSIDELIGSGVSGQVAVGRYTVHIHPEHGAIVQVTPPGQQPIPKLRLTAEEELRPVPEPPSPIGPRERSPLALLPNEEKHLLATLAAMGGGPVGGPHLVAVAGVPEPEPALADLLNQELIQADGPRYSLTGNLATDLPGTWDLKDWRNRALDHFIAWSEANRSAVTDEISAMRCLLEHASRSGLPAEAIRLGRVFEGALLVSGRWQAWAETLERVLGAARSLGDRKTEAWALHQLGTRAFCLDERTAASDFLTKALEIRESIGDHGGAAATFHNMSLLLGPAALLPKAVDPSKHGLRHLLFWILLPALVLVVGAVLASRAFTTGNGPEPEPAEEASLETSETDSPPVAIVEENGEEEEPLVSDPEPPLTTEAPVSEPPAETEIPGIEIPEETPADAPAGPELQLLPHRLDFGEVPVGSASEDLIVIISNPGDAPLAIDSIGVRGEDAAEFAQDGRCQDVSIDPGDECRFGVVFTPEGTGRRNARL